MINSLIILNYITNQFINYGMNQVVILILDIKLNNVEY
jgi:hypothetical protein